MGDAAAQDRTTTKRHICCSIKSTSFRRFFVLYQEQFTDNPIISGSDAILGSVSGYSGIGVVRPIDDREGGGFRAKGKRVKSEATRHLPAEMKAQCFESSFMQIRPDALALLYSVATQLMGRVPSRDELRHISNVTGLSQNRIKCWLIDEAKVLTTVGVGKECHGSSKGRTLLLELEKRSAANNERLKQVESLYQQRLTLGYNDKT